LRFACRPVRHPERMREPSAEMVEAIRRAKDCVLVHGEFVKEEEQQFECMADEFVNSYVDNHDPLFGGGGAAAAATARKREVNEIKTTLVAL
jgi:hypothetical protein